MVKVNPIQMQKFLKGVNYPASKESILAKAEENDAPEDVRALLDQIPDEEYGSPTNLNEAVKEFNQD